ncbi:MAG: prolyl oligopeptidase family serine peptidase [Fibrobacterota bacterium]
MLNQIGAYGTFADRLLGKKTGALSLRSGQFKSVAAWRKQSRARVLELLAPPPLPVPRCRVVARGEYDGLAWEKLQWQLPWGPPTDAVFLKPLSAGKGQRLPAVLALHDHGGNKYFGWRKIADISGPVHPLVRKHRKNGYGGLAWANEAARRGYAVLVHDTFAFASRRVLLKDLLPEVRNAGIDPGVDEKPEDILAYNAWAAGHENLMAKSLFSAGTTWPGLFLRDDQAALSVLCGRRDVDPKRVACGGLSGGGLRTVFLAGLDDRIRCCFCAGFFTTWRDFMLNKAWTHTWMTFVPLLPRELDFSEILTLRAPRPTLVQQCDRDPLFTLSEVKRASTMARETYRLANAPNAYRFSLYPGAHVLNAAMQKEAFDWFEKWL